MASFLRSMVNPPDTLPATPHLVYNILGKSYLLTVFTYSITIYKIPTSRQPPSPGAQDPETKLLSSTGPRVGFLSAATVFLTCPAAEKMPPPCRGFREQTTALVVLATDLTGYGNPPASTVADPAFIKTEFPSWGCSPRERTYGGHVSGRWSRCRDRLRLGLKISRHLLPTR